MCSSDLPRDNRNDPVKCLTYHDPFSATYKKYIFTADGQYLLGGIMIGDVGSFTKLVAITKKKVREAVQAGCDSPALTSFPRAEEARRPAFGVHHGRQEGRRRRRWRPRRRRPDLLLPCTLAVARFRFSPTLTLFPHVERSQGCHRCLHQGGHD